MDQTGSKKAKPALRKPARRTSTAKKPAARPGRTATKPTIPELPLSLNPAAGLGAKLLQRASHMKSVADQVIGWAGTAAEMAVGAAKPLISDPASRKAVEAAGSFLKDARETAGLSADELAQAVKIDDFKVLELAESGKIALPFEVILRIASLLSRNDPLPFAMNLSRGFAPGVWAAFEQLGIGRLVVHAGREHEFINIYRSRDAVRNLTDGEFAQLISFVSSAVDVTVGLVEEIRGSGEEG
jgi:transcriptional regulator with XRE-family HTH domain